MTPLKHKIRVAGFLWVVLAWSASNACADEPANLAPTPDFEKDGPWQLVNLFGSDGRAFRDKSLARTGQYSMHVRKGNAKGRTVLVFFARKYPVAVTPEKVYEASAWVRGMGGRVEIGTQYRDEHMNHAGYVAGDALQVGTAWQKISTTCRPPRNARYIEVVLRHTGTGDYWWDSVELRAVSVLPRELVQTPGMGRTTDARILKDITVDGAQVWRADWVWGRNKSRPMVSAFVNHCFWATEQSGSWGDPSTGYLLSKLAGDGVRRVYWDVTWDGDLLYATSIDGAEPYRMPLAGIDYGSWDSLASASACARRAGLQLYALIRPLRPEGDLLPLIAEEVCSNYAVDGVLFACQTCTGENAPPDAVRPAIERARRAARSKPVRLALMMPPMQKEQPGKKDKEPAPEHRRVLYVPMAKAELDALRKMSDELKSSGELDDVLEICVSIPAQAEGRSLAAAGPLVGQALSRFLDACRRAGAAEAAVTDTARQLTANRVEEMARFTMPTGTVLFEKEIDLPEKPEFAWLSVTGDARYWLSVNGVSIGFDTDWWRAETYTLTSFLKKGRNTLSVKVEGPGGMPGAFLAEGVFHSRGGKKIRIRSDDGWSALWLPAREKIETASAGLAGQWPRYRLKAPGRYLIQERDTSNLAGIASGAEANSGSMNHPNRFPPENAFDGKLEDLSSWSGKGMPNWLEVRFPRERTVSHARLYFGYLAHAQNPSTECSPRDFRLQAWVDNQWKDVMPAVKDSPVCSGTDSTTCLAYDFRPVKTRRFRLYIEATNDPGKRVHCPDEPCVPENERVVYVREMELY